MKIRKMYFGKYKGTPILSVIDEHIGYIMWCLENVAGFSLNETEQKYYDYRAIAIKKYNHSMTFPEELMYKYVKDQEALERLETPIECYGLDYFIPLDVDIAPALSEAGVLYIPKSQQHNSSSTGECLDGLQHSLFKELDEMTEDELDEMQRDGIEIPVLPLL